MTLNPVPIPVSALAAEVAAQIGLGSLGGVVADGAVVTPAGTAGALPGSLAAWRAETVAVTQFGAVGDARAAADGTVIAPGTDDTAAFVAAFAWLAAAPGRALTLPAGTYNLASLAAPLAMPPGAGLRGAGMHCSRILWNDTAGGNLFATAGTQAAPVSDIAFEDFTVTGSCNAHWAAASGGFPFLLQYAQGVAIRRVCSEWSRAMGFALRECGNVAIEGAHVRWSASDGISVTACNNATLVGPVVEWTGDDAISWHSDTAELQPHGTLVLSGFRIRHAAGGVNALGAKLLAISDGVIELVRFQGISIGGSNGATEGYTSTYGASVCNVVIRDMLDAGLDPGGASGCRAICINSATPDAGGLAAAPGLAGTGGVVPLAGRVDGNAAGAPVAIGTGVLLSNVQVLVGRSAVAQYSDWGLGPMFTRHGWIDPAVPVSALQPGAIDCLDGILRDVRLVNCVFEGGGGAVAVYLAPGVRLIGCELIGCVFRDYAGCVVYGNGLAQDISLLGGLIDLDPYLTAPARNGGAWANQGAQGTPALLQGNGSGGFALRGVTLRNLYALTETATPNLFFAGCVLRCAPGTVGYGAGNLGIGVVPAAGEGFVLLAEDCNPASATFGQVVFAPSLDATAMPAAGIWLAGQFVRNAAPAVAGGRLLLGWSRLSTGSGNVAGTDWVPAVAGIS